MYSIARRMFSKDVNKNSEFKSFFRLRLQDRPIKLASKMKETYKKNKTIRRLIYYGKYIFGKRHLNYTIVFSFFFFALPGTFLPG